MLGLLSVPSSMPFYILSSSLPLMPHKSRPGIDLLLFDKEGGAAGWRRLGGEGKGLDLGGFTISL